MTTTVKEEGRGECTLWGDRRMHDERAMHTVDKTRKLQWTGTGRRGLVWEIKVHVEWQEIDDRM